MVLSCGKKAISITKGNNVYRLQWFLLPELPSFHIRTKSKLVSRKRACEDKDFGNIIISSEDTKILEFSHYQKSDKAPFMIYANQEYLIEKIYGCKNSPEN